ncbi:MAG: YkvA family protein [Cyanobacteria bacterium J06627_8]
MKLFGWYRMLMRNPQSRWLVIVGSLLYLISPIDLSPDVFPFLGQIDDVVLASLLFSELFQWLLGGNQLEPTVNDKAQPGRADDMNDPTVQTVDVEAVSIDEEPTRKRKK